MHALGGDGLSADEKLAVVWSIDSVERIRDVNVAATVRV